MLGTTGPLWQREYYDHLIINVGERRRVTELMTKKDE
jgi:hypothetical protein